MTLRHKGPFRDTNEMEDFHNKLKREIKKLWTKKAPNITKKLERDIKRQIKKVKLSALSHTEKEKELKYLNKSLQEIGSQKKLMEY